METLPLLVILLLIDHVFTVQTNVILLFFNLLESFSPIFSEWRTKLLRKISLDFKIT